MTRVNLELRLPDALAHDAEARGLLTAEAVERLLRVQITRRHRNEMRDHLDQVASTPGTPMTPDEFEAEIAAFREH